MNIENWDKKVLEAFNRFAELKYDQLTGRVFSPKLNLGVITDTFGFPRGTREATRTHADLVRRRVYGRVVTPVWERTQADPHVE